MHSDALHSIERCRVLLQSTLLDQRLLDLRSVIHPTLSVCRSPYAAAPHCIASCPLTLMAHRQCLRSLFVREEQVSLGSPRTRRLVDTVDLTDRF